MARTSSDSHSGLLFNRVTNYLAAVFVFLLLVSILITYTLTYTIRRDCNHPYSRTFKLFGYWMMVDAGSTKKVCPQP